MVISYFQPVGPQCKVKSFSTRRVHRKKTDVYGVDGFCGHCNTVFEVMGIFYHYFPCQEACLFLTEKQIQRGFKKWKLDELREQYIQEKCYVVMEMYKCD